MLPSTLKMHIQANGARYQHYVYRKGLTCTYLDKQTEAGDKIQRCSNTEIEM